MLDYINAFRHIAARWLSKGLWAITDQGLYGLSNFGLNILLARWLTQADYGAFSVSYSLFLLVGAAHTAFVSQPMLVFGPKKHSDNLRQYLTTLVRVHWFFGIAAAVLFGLLAEVMGTIGQRSLAPVLAGLSFASPLILFQWLMRRACYASMRPRLAAWSGATYLSVMALGIAILHQYGRLRPASALALMGAASFVAGLTLVNRLGVRLLKVPKDKLMRELLRDHFGYGRWAGGAAGLSWLAGNMFYIALPFFAGLGAVGLLRAGFNVIMPVMQVLSALSMLALPVMARAVREGALRITAVGLMAIFGVLAIVYSSFIIAFAGPIVSFLYGTRYLGLPRVEFALGFLPVTSAMVFVLNGALRSLELLRSVFFAYLASAVVTVVLGTWLVYSRAALGAAEGMLLSSIVTGVVLAVQVVGVARRGGSQSRQGAR